MDTSGLLYDLPPSTIEELCRVLDTGVDPLSWRRLAAQVVSSILEVQALERVEAAGRSPSRELLWTWSMQNSRVQDLIKVLQDMGHYRALQILKGPDPAVPAPGNQSFTLTLKDVIKGTRNFHPDLRISEGTFCDLYRAQTGTKSFTVKLYKQITEVPGNKVCDVFWRETEIQRLHKHKNIAEQLFSFCEEHLCCQVFPHLSNGSLFNKLHLQGENTPLTCIQRLTIIKGTAKALHYLHIAKPQPLICGSICSANILLDEHLQPKLTDLGSAHLYLHSANQQQHTVTMDTSLMRNHGYLPEEFIRSKKMSCSLDVYSFGTVIMETVTGREVTGHGPKQSFLRDMLLSEVEDGGGLNSCLQYVDVSAGTWQSEVALSLLELSLNCTSSRPHHRPSMERVLMTLSTLLPPPPLPMMGSSTSPQPLSLQNIDYLSPPSSVSQEHGEAYIAPFCPTQAEPCECSQSEVTYLSVASHGGKEELNSSLPVQCSCSEGYICEDCVSNGFKTNTSDSLQGECSH
ncbi:interleukin-1 receptor-associated kinase 3 [Halichoeres trimaculatus]|uniref:interleukin-1 receptor-associated kinase 3 n=1 Tax=Halichoeres trimaculatus TaxID=147232 RepID=UPI003D9F1AB9